MIGKRSGGIIGILTSETGEAPAFTEAGFCRKLCLIGSKQGLTVYVFCPSSIRADRESVLGFMIENGVWKKRLFPPPDIVYDRFFARDHRQRERKRRALSVLSQIRPFAYLARGLTGKWRVYRALEKFPAIASYLPETSTYDSPSQLSFWLDSHRGDAFLKPQNGTHGKHTLHVSVPRSKDRDRLSVIGRDGQNEVLRHLFKTRKEGLEWIDRFTGGRPFLIQPYLDLNTSAGEPFDIRVLMQKNDKGAWELTGMAARVGPKHALTSNLHGGGRAYRALPLLIREFGEHAAGKIHDLIRELSMTIPFSLESHFGRLAELGIDFGVDRKGGVWVLEVNSKPGRSSFFRIGEPLSAKKAIENPILYARYLLLSKP